MKPKKSDAEVVLDELQELRKKIPFLDEERGEIQLDAELILGQLAAIRKKIPFLAEGVPRQPEDGRTRSMDGMPLETAEDFDWAVVIDGVESLANDLSAALDQKRAALVETLLDVYYAAEEASHDPANAHLIEYVEQMRAAYERDFGRPIPPKGN